MAEAGRLMPACVQPEEVPTSAHQDKTGPSNVLQGQAASLEQPQAGHQASASPATTTVDAPEATPHATSSATPLVAQSTSPASPVRVYRPHLAPLSPLKSWRRQANQADFISSKCTCLV